MSFMFKEHCRQEMDGKDLIEMEEAGGQIVGGCVNLRARTREFTTSDQNKANMNLI